MKKAVFTQGMEGAKNQAAGTGAIEIMPGVFEIPVTMKILAQLGFEPYGTATLESMRIYENSQLLTLEFWYPADDPALGATAGIKSRVATKPGKTYRLTAEIYDGYEPDKYPNRIVQKTAVDGQVVDVHDISVPAFVGERAIKHTFTAKKAQTDVAVYLEVVGPLEPWHWGYACRTIVREFIVEPV